MSRIWACLVIVASTGALGSCGGASQEPAPAGSGEAATTTAPRDPKSLGLAEPTAEFPGFVSCQASLTNHTGQTLTVTSVSSTPAGSDGWSATFSAGDQIPPGGTISASISNAAAECSASMGFQSAGGGFSAGFDNPWNSASTWGCTNAPDTACAADGNSHGQPLVVTFNITAP